MFPIPRIALASILVPVLVVASGSTGTAFTDLTLGKKVSAKDKENPKSDRINFKFSNDPALLTIPESPLCPTETRVQLVTDAGVLPEQVLDCSRWSVAGTGFKYKEKTPLGGARKVIYKPGRLSVILKGDPYSNAPVAGPVDWIETRVTIGSSDYCGRWSAPPGRFKKNQADRIVLLGPAEACQVVCGNGIEESGEECDDGNGTNGDGCDVNCTVTACGNGIQTAGEACDDGNPDVGDGCRPDCTVEVCGDGIVDPVESCDDGNTADGDCCSSSCAFESAGSTCEDDGNPCSDDECDGAGTCTHPGNANPCDDLEVCTVGDVCDPGTATCNGTPRAPWINEFDYDDFFGNLEDRDEFVEIAGVAGSDLSGYQVLAVEGGATIPCRTPFDPPQPLPGEAHVLGTLPPGTLLGDAGNGIGFLVVCLAGTSTNVANLPACDVIVPAPRLDSNLLNGHLLNADEVTCPDGILLLDDLGAYVDAVSYEGIMPAVAPYGTLFHTQPTYSAPRDEGWLPGVSIEKVTSTLERAQDETEWVDPSETVDCVGQGGLNPPPECVSYSWTPGTDNNSQLLECSSSSGAFVDGVAAGLW